MKTEFPPSEVLELPALATEDLLAIVSVTVLVPVVFGSEAIIIDFKVEGAAMRHTYCHEKDEKDCSSSLENVSSIRSLSYIYFEKVPTL